MQQETISISLSVTSNMSLKSKVSRRICLRHVCHDTHLEVLRLLENNQELAEDNFVDIPYSTTMMFSPRVMSIGSTFILTWFIITRASVEIVGKVLSMNPKAAEWENGACFHLACAMGWDEVSLLLMKYYPKALIERPTIIKLLGCQYPCVFFVVNPLCLLSSETKLKLIKASPDCLKMTPYRHSEYDRPAQDQRLPVNEILDGFASVDPKLFQYVVENSPIPELCFGHWRIIKREYFDQKSGKRIREECYGKPHLKANQKTLINLFPKISKIFIKEQHTAISHDRCTVEFLPNGPQYPFLRRTIVGNMASFSSLKELTLSMCGAFPGQPSELLEMKSLGALEVLTLRLGSNRWGGRGHNRWDRTSYGIMQQVVENLKQKKLKKFGLTWVTIQKELNAFLMACNLPEELELVVSPLRAHVDDAVEEPDEADNKKVLEQTEGFFFALGKSNVQRLKLKFHVHCYYHDGIPLPDIQFAPVLRNPSLVYLEVDGGTTFEFENFGGACCEALGNSSTLKEIVWDGSIEHDSSQLTGILSALRQENNVLQRFKVYEPRGRVKKSITEAMKHDYAAIRFQLVVNGDRSKHWVNGCGISSSKFIKLLVQITEESAPKAKYYWRLIPETWQLSRSFHFLRSNPGIWSHSLEYSINSTTSNKRKRKRKRGM